jgi:hypothetical protein
MRVEFVDRKEIIDRLLDLFLENGKLDDEQMALLTELSMEGVG